MDLYVCENVFVPLRSGPSHKSEMLSQVLFGERYRITDKSGNWLKIETQFDNYPGWIDTDHLQHSEYDPSSHNFVLNRPVTCIKFDETRMVLEAGCEIFDPDFGKKTFHAGKNSYSVKGEFNSNYISLNESIPETALRFINSPYIWGGRIPCGIDCSGLTQLVYKLHGIALPRDSWKQAESGANVDFIDSAVPGDLVFFDNEKGSITHVGMILSSGLVIHASGRVRIDRIDHQGIYKYEKNGYSHRLRLVRRILTGK
ncbi:MAG TPA: C40 family peptidase [Bacteroidales bacterium]|nr:C40 family peptidase [Bacteroidales bacterium]